MITYVTFNLEGVVGTADTLEAAHAHPCINLIVETDSQYHPHRILRAWASVAYAGGDKHWQETAPDAAAHAVAGIMLHNALNDPR